MSLRLVAAVGLFCLPGVAVTLADEKELASAMKKLEGTWEPTENILGGMPTPREVLKDWRTVVKNDTYENQHLGKPDTKGPLKFVANRDKILHLDLHPTEGPGKGKVVRCIFEWVDDDEFRLCMPSEPDGERPTEFTSKKGNGQILRTYTRVKE
jgi:uncharacterized protein (TIGR03067 family)